jgi:hypothetical protein
MLANTTEFFQLLRVHPPEESETFLPGDWYVSDDGVLTVDESLIEPGINGSESNLSVICKEVMSTAGRVLLLFP